MPTIRVKDPMVADGPMIVYYGARFDHVAAPTRPIVGTVRDKDTGAPIPGVHITGMPNIPNSLITTPGVEATTDAQGRYRVDGLPVARGFKLFTEAPAGQPYVNCGFVSPAGEPRPGPFTFDIALKRGVLVRGRLTDKATGRPLRGSVIYHAFADNPHLDEYPNFKRGSQETRVVIPDDDGRFVDPGPAGPRPDRRPGARGRLPPRHRRRGHQGLRQGTRGLPDLSVLLHDVRPARLRRDQPRAGDEGGHPRCSRSIPAGRSRARSSIPMARPSPAGSRSARSTSSRVPQQTPMNSPTFVVKGLPAGRYRLDFFHRGRKLAGSLVLKGDEKGDLTVKLQPWGTVVGRVVDEEGKPRTDVEIFSTIRERPDPERGDLEDKPTVDAQGRFRIEGLVPGVKYDALGDSPNKANGPILKGVQVGPGEVKDLGDIKLPSAKQDGN